MVRCYRGYLFKAFWNRKRYYTQVLWSVFSFEPEQRDNAREGAKTLGYK